MHRHRHGRGGRVRVAVSRTRHRALRQRTPGKTRGSFCLRIWPHPPLYPTRAA
ncbi:hypothetical protein [Lysobacter gummosus]|uniref:hypothetical protein n=1 Tax=Lysobacter gummosus TaxID=262324 RepID=UPI003628514E